VLRVTGRTHLPFAALIRKGSHIGRDHREKAAERFHLKSEGFRWSPFAIYNASQNTAGRFLYKGPGCGGEGRGLNAPSLSRLYARPVATNPQRESLLKTGRGLATPVRWGAHIRQKERSDIFEKLHETVMINEGAKTRKRKRVWPWSWFRHRI